MVVLGCDCARLCRAKIFAVIELPDLGVRQRWGMLVDDERSRLPFSPDISRARDANHSPLINTLL